MEEWYNWEVYVSTAREFSNVACLLRTNKILCSRLIDLKYHISHEWDLPVTMLGITIGNYVCDGVSDEASLDSILQLGGKKLIIYLHVIFDGSQSFRHQLHQDVKDSIVKQFGSISGPSTAVSASPMNGFHTQPTANNMNPLTMAGQPNQVYQPYTFATNQATNHPQMNANTFVPNQPMNQQQSVSRVINGPNVSRNQPSSQASRWATPAANKASISNKNANKQPANANVPKKSCGSCGGSNELGIEKCKFCGSAFPKQ